MPWYSGLLNESDGLIEYENQKNQAETHCGIQKRRLLAHTASSLRSLNNY
jgi:hypothetical protein